MRVRTPLEDSRVLNLCVPSVIRNPENVTLNVPIEKMVHRIESQRLLNPDPDSVVSASAPTRSESGRKRDC